MSFGSFLFSTLLAPSLFFFRSKHLLGAPPPPPSCTSRSAMNIVDKKDISTPHSSATSASCKLRHTSDWVFAQEIPSDVTVEAGGVAFALHKFPLVSRSGWIRKLVAEANDSDLSWIELPDIPGGADVFELAAKFCYGISIKINAANVAVLRCAAEYLEMSDVYGEGNLIERTEAYLNDVVMASLPTVVTVLQNCEKLLPMAEELSIVSRCVEVAAKEACREHHLGCGLSSTDYSGSSTMMGVKNSNFSSARNSPARKNWWAEELSVLRIDFFQRVLSAMGALGLRYDSLGGVIVQYAQKSLRGLITRNGKEKLKFTATEHEHRVLIESIVSLLPQERNSASVSFLFGILRVAIYLDTTLACRLDLEQRIGLQLEQASLDDLLIPSLSYSGDTFFDVDTIHRIVISFLQQDDTDFCDPLALCEPDNGGSPSQSAIMKVARLLDSYLAEIAPDANLSVNKFIGLAGLMPDYARVVDDGLYMAIDTYLKAADKMGRWEVVHAHPALNDIERKKICKMDCQKLSQEACVHAAQNERLPVNLMVQVLYFEQMRLRNAIAGGDGNLQLGGNMSQRMTSGAVSAAVSPREEEGDYAAMYHENRELKLELAQIKARLNNLENERGLNSEKQVKTVEKPPSSNKKRIFRSFSKKISKLNPFQQINSKDLPFSPDLITSKRTISMS